MDRINAIAERHGLAVIEDAAEAVGAVRAGRRVGARREPGDLRLLPEQADDHRRGRHGHHRRRGRLREAESLSNQGRSDTGDWLEHDRLGFNYRLDELSAAVGLAQVERLDEILAGRAARGGALRRAARRLDGVEVPAAPARATSAPGSSTSSGLDAEIDRNAVMAVAAGARRGLQAVPAGRPPAAVLPRARAPRGRAARWPRRSPARRSPCRSTPGSTTTTRRTSPSSSRRPSPRS